MSGKSSFRKGERKDYGESDYLGNTFGINEDVSQYFILDVREKGCLKVWSLREKMPWRKGSIISVGDRIGKVRVGGDLRMKGLVTNTEYDEKKKRFNVTFRVVFKDYKPGLFEL